MRKLLSLLSLLIFAIGVYLVSTNKIKPSSKNTTSPVSEVLVLKALNNYPAEQILKPEFGGKVFCAWHLYGFDEEKDKNMVYAYVWAYCEEYYQKDKQITIGSGVSMPIKVVLELQNGVLGVHNHLEPENGEGYARSIREMFADRYEDEAIKGIDINTLTPSPKTQAEKSL